MFYYYTRSNSTQEIIIMGIFIGYLNSATNNFYQKIVQKFKL